MEKKELWIEKRFLEIFKSTSEEMEYVLGMTHKSYDSFIYYDVIIIEKAERQANQPWDNVIKVKGLPYKVPLR